MSSSSIYVTWELVKTLRSLLDLWNKYALKTNSHPCTFKFEKNLYIIGKQALLFDISQETEMATHSSNPAWKIPWTEQPGGLQSMGSQRVAHD